MEIYALGLTILVGLIWAAWRVAKGKGITEAELDAALARIEALQKASEEAKQNEKIVTNLSRDELRKRLQD